MKTCHRLFSFIAILLTSTVVWAAEPVDCDAQKVLQQSSAIQVIGGPGPEQFRDSWVSLLEGIERTYGMNDEASRGFIEATPDQMELIYNWWNYKPQFFQAVPQILEHMEQIEPQPPVKSGQDQYSLERATNGPTLMGLLPEYPDYPTGYAYTFLKDLGMVSAPGERCGGDALEIYKSAIFGAEMAIYLGDRACTIAGCDPTGIACASVCGAVELVKTGVEAARMPITLCKDLDEDINAAEISADYLNDVDILTNLGGQSDVVDGIASDLDDHDARLITHDITMTTSLATHDGDVKTAVSSHDSDMKSALSLHDGDIKAQLATHDEEIKDLLEQVLANQETMISNQEYIMKLLVTPEGKRPGWNKQGFK